MKPLSSTEIGCALSHIKAYREFIKSGDSHALIIEDDIIGNPSDILEIERISSKLSDGDILFCGGQDGLKGYKYLRGWGRVAHDSPDLYKIPSIFIRFISRACCYVITPAVANDLIQKQQACLDRSDYWRMLLKGSIGVYFIDKLSHPTDLRSSHIEKTRLKRSTINKALADGLIYTATSQIIKLLTCIPVLRRITKNDMENQKSK